MSKTAGLPIFFLLSVASCATFDDGLNAVGDALKGDFRALAKSSGTTLDKMCRELSQNQVVGAKKLARSRVSFPAVVTRVSGEYGQIGGFHVAFRDYYKTAHSGHAWTRSSNLSNEEKVTGLKLGDKITVTGILAMKLSRVHPGQCSLDFDNANFEKLAKTKKK